MSIELSCAAFTSGMPRILICLAPLAFEAVVAVGIFTFMDAPPEPGDFCRLVPSDCCCCGSVMVRSLMPSEMVC